MRKDDASKVHYQIGAPALIHRENSTVDNKEQGSSSFLQVPGHKYPRRDAETIAELLQRRNRIAARWYYTAEDFQEQERLKNQERQDTRQKRRLRRLKEYETEPKYFQQLQQNRWNLLKQQNDYLHYSQLGPRELLNTYAAHDRPYESANLVKNRSSLRGGSSNREPKLETKQMLRSRKMTLQRRDNSDPAYLAPFGLDALLDAEQSNDTTTYSHPSTRDKDRLDCLGPRPWQGNCLLCISCPCPNCCCSEEEPSWCLFHPKGLSMDTLCVSNLLPPNGKENAGHIFTVAGWQKDDHKMETVAAAQLYFPNDLCLDETIVEIQQSGTWDVDHLDCVFVVRTATHISVVNVSVSKPDLSAHDNVRAKSDYDDNTCWGNYVLKEHSRFDLRSHVNSTPSYRPVSLACHPNYGNAYSSARFAFVSYSEHSGDQNVIHQVTADDPHEGLTSHPISSLRHISLIDFTRTHPMCLWCAASSYVRPALVPEVYFRKQYPLGFGTSLYSVDLRTNSSVFQWSPSAQEMKPEGVYSISGILTDLDRDHTVWVTSKSAGKTWEIDSRMPCQVVNSWSLSSDCDVDSVSFSQRGPHGDPVLLSKIRDFSNDYSRADSNMILTMDTAPTAFGFQLLQRPRHKPRFQTESLECTSIPGAENHNDSRSSGSSIVTTSVFAMPEWDEDMFCCGMTGFRTPMRTFVSGETRAVTSRPFHNDNDEDETNILCTLSMTNKGDIFCHSLLETSRHVSECRSFPGLPAGTAAIPLPNELDGTTNTIEHKCWKPTGGMNLKLFWTNHYPTPRDALPLVKPTVSQQIPLLMKDAKMHLSYKAGQGEEAYSVQVPLSSGIRISAPTGSELVHKNNPDNGAAAADKGGVTSLVIPQKSAAKAFATRLKFRTAANANATGKSGESHQKDGIDNKSGNNRRSDLTAALVEKVSNTWELWEKLDDSSSEEE